MRLDLNPSRLPTVSEYKKAYREKLKNHPDKGGDTAIFQGITEAVMAVWQFMAKNQDRQSRPETDKDTALLRKFEKSNNVSYNKGSVVFDIDGSKADILIDCLKKRVGPPETLSDGSGVKMKVEQFKMHQKEVVETILMNVENQQEMVKRSTVEKKVKVVDMNIGY